MGDSYRPVVLLTGCGSGLGYALAELLHGLGQFRVVITARTRSLEFLRAKFPESDRTMVRELDVSMESHRKRICAEVAQTWGGVDILVNNAGISYRAVVEHMTEEEESQQLQTNYLGPMGLIREVVPHMRAKGRGKIINISSVSGMLAMPTMSSYSASKYALEGASEALWYEMKPLGINVCLIQPGFVRSSSFFNVYYTKASEHAEHSDDPYSDYYQNMTPFIERMMQRSLSSPDDIARVILKTIRRQKPPLWIPATLDAIVFYYVRRWIPRRFLLPFLFRCLPNSRNWARTYTHRRN